MKKVDWGCQNYSIRGQQTLHDGVMVVRDPAFAFFYANPASRAIIDGVLA
jgi:hypothetical protein